MASGLWTESMAGEPRGARFPAGMLATSAELALVPSVRRLERVLRSLVERFIMRLRHDGEAACFQDAAVELATAGAGLVPLLVSGRIVLNPGRAYWTARPLLSIGLLEDLEPLLDDSERSLLQEALALDSLIRSEHRR